MKTFLTLLRNRLNKVFSLKEVTEMVDITNRWLIQQALEGKVIDIPKFGIFLTKSAQKNPVVVFIESTVK